jgi:hypothetical protein
VDPPSKHSLRVDPPPRSASLGRGPGGDRSRDAIGSLEPPWNPSRNPWGVPEETSVVRALVGPGTPRTPIIYLEVRKYLNSS